MPSQGGGRLKCSVRPLAPKTTLPPLKLTQRGTILSISIKAFISGRIPDHVAQRMVKAARKALGTEYDDDRMVNVQIERSKGVGDGCGIQLTARTDNGCFLGANGAICVDYCS